NSWWIVSALVLVIAAGYFQYTRVKLGWILGFCVFFLAGALHIQLRDSATHLDTSVLPFADRQEVTITAHVIRDGHIRWQNTEFIQSVDIETEEIQAADNEQASVNSGVRMNVYGRPVQSDSDMTDASAKISAPRAFRYGERIRLICRLRA